MEIGSEFKCARTVIERERVSVLLYKININFTTDQKTSHTK